MEKLSRNVLASKCHFGYIVSNDRLKKVDKVVLDCAYFCFFSKHPGHQGQKSAVPLTIINSTRKFQPPPEQGQRKYTQQSALQIYPHSPSFLAKKHHVKTTGHSDYLCKLWDTPSRLDPGEARLVIYHTDKLWRNAMATVWQWDFFFLTNKSLSIFNFLGEDKHNSNPPAPVKWLLTIHQGPAAWLLLEKGLSGSRDPGSSLF